MSRIKRWTIISATLSVVIWAAVAVIMLSPAAQGAQDALGKWIKAPAVAPAVISLTGFWVIGASGGPQDGTWGSTPGPTYDGNEGTH
ncbi:MULTISPECIES: hypothetical protein [Streptomyces]|uniref:hypothetical protein n=1 Tax=Streptomyces TaxID=1883 RepID=UPI0036CDF073